MDIYTINDKNYFLANQIMERYPKLFKACVSMNSFIEKRQIPKKSYLFARYNANDDAWDVSDGRSRKYDKLFVNKKWFETKYPDAEESLVNDIEDAPAVIVLKDHEKFTDNDDNTIDIEVRGKREFDKCYFKVKDIMTGFGINSLHKTLIDKHGSYTKGVHYKYFYVYKNEDLEENKSKKLFLSYNGLLRVLFASHRKTTDKFMKWVTKTLFTIQMGIPDQKKQFVRNMLGIDAETIRDFIGKTCHGFPCVYLFSIGSVKHLRSDLKITSQYDDDSIVYRYGTTDDLLRRTCEHQEAFSKLKNAQAELVQYSYVDPKNILKAEKCIKHFFKERSMKLHIEKYDELVVISRDQMELVKKQYDMIGYDFAYQNSEIVAQLKDKDHQNEILKKDIKLIKTSLESEISKKDLEIELLKKDLEIANLKLGSKSNKRIEK